MLKVLLIGISHSSTYNITTDTVTSTEIVHMSTMSDNSTSFHTNYSIYPIRSFLSLSFSLIYILPFIVYSLHYRTLHVSLIWFLLKKLNSFYSKQFPFINWKEAKTTELFSGISLSNIQPLFPSHFAAFGGNACFCHLNRIYIKKNISHIYKTPK